VIELPVDRRRCGMRRDCDDVSVVSLWLVGGLTSEAVIRRPHDATEGKTIEQHRPLVKGFARRTTVSAINSVSPSEPETTRDPVMMRRVDASA